MEEPEGRLTPAPRLRRERLSESFHLAAQIVDVGFQGAH